MNIYLVILFLIHIKIGYCFNVLTNSLIGYGTYSLMVDFWASIQVNNMKLLENIDTLNNEPVNNEFNLQKNKYMISSLSNIVEDLDYRNQWNIFMNETRNNNLLYDGNYTFLHRNYVNNEEKLAMCNGRNTIHKLFIKLPENGKVNIKNNIVELNELFVFFSFYPLKIKWIGNIVDKQVIWNYTEFRTPNNIVENPEKAKELSKYPWNITACSNEYVIFTRDKENCTEQLIYGNI